MGHTASERQGQAWTQNQRSGKPRVSAQVPAAKLRAPPCSPPSTSLPWRSSEPTGAPLSSCSPAEPEAQPAEVLPGEEVSRGELGGLPSLYTSWPLERLGKASWQKWQRK